MADKVILDEFTKELNALWETNENPLFKPVRFLKPKPCVVAREMKARMGADPSLTLTKLAEEKERSTYWVKRRLALLNLSKKCQQLVDGGKIKLPNALRLSKIDRNHQFAFIEEAQILTCQQFYGHTWHYFALKSGGGVKVVCKVTRHDGYVCRKYHDSNGQAYSLNIPTTNLTFKDHHEVREKIERKRDNAKTITAPNTIRVTPTITLT